MLRLFERIDTALTYTLWAVTSALFGFTLLALGRFIMTRFL